jgi:murein DD-endopeptidase MepM/ murein hydrolase activator NlpD
VTHADDEALTAAPRPATRSPKLVRTVLLGACAAGLVGLALPGSPVNVSTLAAATSPSYASLATVTGTELLHVPSFVTVALPPRAPARASRSRAVALAKVTTKAKKAVVSDTWVRPSSASVVSPFGPRWGRMHNGIDFGAGYGAPIRSMGDGIIIGSGYLAEESGYGLITLIRHSNGFVSAYAHQSSTLVQAGDSVRAGDVIGYVGSTGNSTGAHLHFEIRTETHGGQIDPLPWLRAHGVSI